MKLPDNNHLAEWERQLGQFVLNLAVEESAISEFVDDDIEFALTEFTVVEVDGADDGTIHVTAVEKTTQAEKVCRARYNPPGKAHPAEYKNHPVMLRGDFTFDPAGLGTVNGEIHQEGGAPAPPAPDI